MITASGQGQLGSGSMSAQGSGGNFILVHEPDDICGALFHVEGLVLVGVAEVALVEDVHVAVVQDLKLVIGTRLSLKNCAQF